MHDLEDWLTSVTQKTMLNSSSTAEKQSLLKGGAGEGQAGRDVMMTRDVGSYDTFQGRGESPDHQDVHDVSSEELYAKECGLEAPPKTIDTSGSWALTVNNIIGPAMMSLPHLFQQAGILPTSFVIILCAGGASLCSTFLSDAISSIPGNSNFDQNIEFGTAFRRVIGEDAFYVAEVLFLISCMVQAVAGLVEAAQGLDGFLASFITGKTYALQLLPSVEFIEWGQDDCQVDADGVPSSDCTPFSEAGPVIVSAGYLLCVAAFFPLSRGYLTEIIWVQMLVVVTSLVLLLQFEAEFLNRGFSVDIPWVGNEFGSLAGVILFNFAFSITVPTWLKEKNADVDVNTVIWSSTSVSTVVYIAFGWTMAMSFPNVDTEALKDLASPQTHLLTRVAAALFGVSIIGCGVPVFCVMIKGALYSSRIADASWSFFWGAVFPYLISFVLYQGSALMDILNWTGLVVNGSVAFILPLILALYTMKAQRRKKKSDELERRRIKHELEAGLQTSIRSLTDEVAGEEARRLGLAPGSGVDLGFSPQVSQVDLTKATSLESSTLDDAALVDEEFAVDGSIHPLPAWLMPYRKAVIAAMLAFFCAVIGATIIFDIATGTTPDTR
jgi:amino acid permease